VPHRPEIRFPNYCISAEMIGGVTPFVGSNTTASTICEPMYAALGKVREALIEAAQQLRACVHDVVLKVAKNELV
jgi:hypothetical protein